MTTRIYYTETDTQAFDATVLSCEPVGQVWHVVLDRTAFYPTSGGQPFDVGSLGGVNVVEVLDRDEADVVHVVDAAIAVGDVVRGEIDWARRFDHMQQHTGQHVLSAAFDRLLGARTVSFHMGGQTSTIDLAREATAEEIGRVEREANRVVWDDRPVRIRFAEADDAAQLPLRKESARAGLLRIVEVDDFDLSACGGTHVARTGSIGAIVVTGWERFKGGARVSFACGGRAVRAHAALRDAVSEATRVLSVSPSELGPSISRMQQDAKHSARALLALRDALAVHRAAELAAAPEQIGRFQVVIQAESEWETSSLKMLAAQIVKRSGLVAVLAGDGEPVPVVVARSQDVDLDASALVRHLTTLLGGRGGGRPELAQAGLPGPAARVLIEARARLAVA